VTFSGCSFDHTSTPLVSTAPGYDFIDVADWTNDGTADILSYYANGDVRIWRNCDTTGINLSTPELPGAASQDLVLFPSPASEHVSIARPLAAEGAAEITVWSLQGRCLLRTTTSAASEQIDVSTWADGPYFVRYRTLNGVWTARSIKAAFER
jgi:hypothetical protein